MAVRGEDTGTEGGAPPALAAEPRRRLAWSTAVFSAATGASRILGLFREIVVRRYFGVEGPINAFTVAFQVPNLIRSLAADVALSSAFVPVFSELLEQRDAARAWRVASTLFWLVLLGLGVLTGLLILIAPLLMKFFGLEGELEQLAVGLSRVLFPIVVLLGLSGIVVGILNSYEQFSVPAITPVFWNLAIIVALVVGVPRVESASGELYVYAGGVLGGTVIQAVTPVWWLRGRDGRIRAVVDLRDPAVKRVFVLMLPVTLGIGLINFNLLVNTFFAARYIDPELAPSAIDAAFRIYMLPQGMFAIAVATVLFPRLSRLAARADAEGFRETVSLGLRQIGFLLVPASAVSAVLAVPIVRLLYQRGAFDAAETGVVASALAAFALGLTFNGTMLMLNRAFFSLQSAWVPTAVALGNLALNVVLNAGLYRFGIWGIPLATSLVNIAGTGALLAVFTRRVGPLPRRELASSYLRIAAASAGAAGAAFAVWRGLDVLVGRSLPAQVLSVGIAVSSAAAAFVLAARILRIRELDAVLSLARRRSRETR
ncbi:MAG: murein biosynthesis integral membrane protein MurJ [Actinomycetota bacterium]|nr:murein biosynthesis integral membrane protein MurJ [Actinomycetota bacterium]